LLDAGCLKCCPECLSTAAHCRWRDDSESNRWARAISRVLLLAKNAGVPQRVATGLRVNAQAVRTLADGDARD
jgi:hypothetical protein